jgi:hypothetical protein
MSTNLQSCLRELELILDKLISLNFYNQYWLTSPTSSLMFMDVNPMMNTDMVNPLFDIMFENMVLQLYKLYEMQPILAKCLVDVSKKDLLKALKEPWRSIYKWHDKIYEWRNKIVSHSKEQSLMHIPYHNLDPDYNKTRIGVVSVSRYAVLYIWGIVGNVSEEFKESTRARAEEMQQIQELEGMEILQIAVQNELKYSRSLNRTLRNAGFKTVKFRGYNDFPMSPIRRGRRKPRKILDFDHDPPKWVTI